MGKRFIIPMKVGGTSLFSASLYFLKGVDANLLPAIIITSDTILSRKLPSLKNPVEEVEPQSAKQRLDSFALLVLL